jgi:hypothetical protein
VTDARRFPPPWSVEEAALPSSPDRNVDNGRGQGIPEVSRSDQPPRPKISRTPLVPVGPAASCRTDANGQALAYVYFEEEPGRRAAAKLLTRDEAWRIAVNIAKLPGLLWQGPLEAKPT